jgi:hypothetical protein
MASLKKCASCKRYKLNEEDFNKNKKNPDGFQYNCKSCMNTYGADYRVKPENKKTAAERNKAWQKENPRHRDGRKKT